MINEIGTQKDNIDELKNDNFVSLSQENKYQQIASFGINVYHSNFETKVNDQFLDFNTNTMGESMLKKCTNNGIAKQKLNQLSLKKKNKGFNKLELNHSLQQEYSNLNDNSWSNSLEVQSLNSIKVKQPHEIFPKLMDLNSEANTKARKTCFLKIRKNSALFLNRSKSSYSKEDVRSNTSTSRKNDTNRDRNSESQQVLNWKGSNEEIEKECMIPNKMNLFNEFFLDNQGCSPKIAHNKQRNEGENGQRHRIAVPRLPQTAMSLSRKDKFKNKHKQKHNYGNVGNSYIDNKKEFNLNACLTNKTYEINKSPNSPIPFNNLKTNHIVFNQSYVSSPNVPSAQNAYSHNTENFARFLHENNYSFKNPDHSFTSTHQNTELSEVPSFLNRSACYSSSGNSLSHKVVAGFKASSIPYIKFLHSLKNDGTSLPRSTSLSNKNQSEKENLLHNKLHFHARMTNGKRKKAGLTPLFTNSRVVKSIKNSKNVNSNDTSGLLHGIMQRNVFINLHPNLNPNFKGKVPTNSNLNKEKKEFCATGNTIRGLDFKKAVQDNFGGRKDLKSGARSPAGRKKNTRILTNNTNNKFVLNHKFDKLKNILENVGKNPPRNEKETLSLICKSQKVFSKRDVSTTNNAALVKYSSIYKKYQIPYKKNTKNN
jgi:hypothetical protein